MSSSTRVFFADTLLIFVAERKQRPIAVLRIDGNYHSSYEDALYSLLDLALLIIVT